MANLIKRWRMQAAAKRAREQAAFDERCREYQHEQMILQALSCFKTCSTCGRSKLPRSMPPDTGGASFATNVVIDGQTVRRGGLGSRSRPPTPRHPLWQAWDLLVRTGNTCGCVPVSQAQRTPASDKPVAPRSPARSSVAEDLARLTALWQTGALTDDEFAQAKTKLLGKSK